MRPTLDLLTPYPPYPPHAGGTAHTFQAMRQLQRYFDLSIFTLTAPGATVEWGPLAAWCRELRAFPRAPVRLAQRLSLDPPAVHQEYSPELAAFLRERWQYAPPDVVQIEFTTMAQYAPLARAAGALTVCTAIHLAYLAQIRRAQRERSPQRRARRWLGALSLWQYELRVLRQCDLVVTLSANDAATLRRWLPRLPVVYIRSGVDLTTLQPCFDPMVEHAVLFVGNYAHPPNVEGAIWLAREVWPLVRATRPDARLTLAGRGPTPPILALAAADIRIPGEIANLRPLYAAASCVVAPIFWGSGVRIKLLEALASGLPIVTTHAAAEGIMLEDGVSALYAEQPAAFAAAIVCLLDDAALRAQIGAAGRAVVERDYDWAQIGRQLAGVYSGALAGKQDDKMTS